MSHSDVRDPPPDGPVRVAVLNDYPVVVAGVRTLLESWSERALVVGPHERPDVFLYDTFGRLHGSALRVEGLLARSTAAKVVVYSWTLDPAMVRSSLGSGAAGYLFKGLDAEELVDALERVRSGETVTSGGAPRTRPPEGSDWPGRAEGLSVREAEIVSLITQGLTNQDIAERSHLSINSVKTYIRTAYRKMGVARRPQAVLWGVQHGFAARQPLPPDGE